MRLVALQAFMGGRCRADRELFEVPSLRRCQHEVLILFTLPNFWFLILLELPLSLLKTAQGHPMEDFCHPRCQVLTRSSFASDMDFGHSRMGIDSGECLNVIFEVTPSNISMSLMRSLIRCTHEVMTALIVLLPLIVVVEISPQLHQSFF
ncbi:unnamed protein product [Sphagnum jensenii]